MPTRPTVQRLSANSVDILNAIRNNASTNYRDYIPQADSSLESVRQIGTILMNYPALQNEFLNALVNRIGRVLVTSKMYDNPWNMFKRGLLEFGETVEEVFVELAKPFEYDPETAESEVFKREIPDVRAAFHILNYQKFYKVTVQREQLRQAFLTWDGVTDLISKIINSMYAGANYDEFIVMKYLVAVNILNGRLKAVQVADPADSANMKSIVGSIKAVSNGMEFMGTGYNMAGVHTYTDKRDQYIILTSDFDATMDVEVLASAFNMDKADFMGRRVLVDSFGSIDSDRLALLFADDPNYTPLTSDQLAALDTIPAVLVDRDWFMILDNLLEFTDQYNGQGLYWNYWLHIWKTLSVSPFANSAVFVAGAPSITSVTVSPDAVTAGAGQTVTLTATVVTANFAPKTVNWSVAEGDPATVDSNGVVTIDADAVAEGTITVTATSTFDSTKTDTCTITVA